MDTAQAGKSDPVILVSQYANHRIIHKEPDDKGNYKIVFELKFRNGRCVLSRKEYERLSKNSAFTDRVGAGKTIGVLGNVSFTPRETAIPEVVNDSGSVKMAT